MIDYIKKYCGIPLAVTVYDEKLKLLRLTALAHLTKNSIKNDETSPLVQSYVAGYCRLYNISEPSEQWRKAEELRLESLIELMFYGGI